MPLPLTAQVNAPSNTSLGDGTVVPALAGKQGDLLVSEVHGKYYNQTIRGNVYYAATAAAGIANTIFSNASFAGLLVWNPQGSGKNLSLIRCNVCYNGAAATAAAGWGYAWVGNAGASLATASVVSGFTQITATRGSCLLSNNAGAGNSVTLAGSAATFTTALTWGRNASFASSTGAITVGTSVSGWTEEFDGTMIVPPGFIFAVTQNILSGGTFGSTLIWEETPI